MDATHAASAATTTATGASPATTNYHSFLCPYCHAELNPNRGPNIGMKARLEGLHFTVTVEVTLSARLGKYQRQMPEGVVLKPGAEINFMCPHCGESFSCLGDGTKDMAAVHMKNGDPELHIVAFSRVVGLRSTYVVDPDQGTVSRSFGRDADDSRWTPDKVQVNFFGA